MPGGVSSMDSIGDKPVSSKEHKQYRSVAGITNHMARWSRQDVQNAQRAISQHLNGPTKTCMLAQEMLTNFIVATKNRGYTIRPDQPNGWDGTKNFLFKIHVESDSDYAKDPSRRSVSCGAT